MEKAKDLKEFVAQIVAHISFGNIIYCDVDNLTYSWTTDAILIDYREYFEMTDEELEKELADVDEMERNVIRDLVESTKLPDCVQPPYSSVSYNWMIDFANENITNSQEINAVRRALNGRQPFYAFRQVLKQYGHIDQWYAFRDYLLRIHVCRELNLPHSVIEE